MSLQRVKFVASEQTKFQSTLRKRVDNYFKEKGISRHADARMVFKTIAVVAMYSVPLVLVFMQVFEPVWINLLLYVVTGFGIGGIGLAVMHDANHGAYSKNEKVNKSLGMLLNFVGGHATTWRIQHNVLHHSFTNVDGLDEDINPGGALRFSPHQPYKKAFRYQHYYAWVLYGLMTLLWITVKDFKQVIRYAHMGLLKGQQTTYAKDMSTLIGWKIFYYAYILVLPLIFTTVPWWLLVSGIVIAHFVAGIILAAIFQPAHVMESCYFPLPDEENKIDNNFAVHQMLTTVNFANNNRLLSWYCGGLNYQVEHHLFPNICHVHYREISKIVKATANEFGVPYYHKESFVGAVREHNRMLKLLGRPDATEKALTSVNLNLFNAAATVA